MKAPVKRENFLVVNALGKETQNILIELAGLAADQRCTILDCRMTVLGEETAVYMLITGNWDAVSRLELNLQQQTKREDILINLLRTPSRPNRPGMPYSVNVVAADGPGIIHDMAMFFGSRRIAVDDMNAGTYNASQSDTRIFTMNMIVRLPPTTHLPSLREEFMLFCDERNLDAVIEPMRIP